MLKEEAGSSVSVFISENICTLVNRFDKAVAEGASNHCGNEVRRYDETEIMHQSIPSARQSPGFLQLLSAQIPRFVPSELPGGRTYYVLSKLTPYEGTFQLQTDLPIYCCSLVTKSVSKLGENFKTLSMVN